MRINVEAFASLTPAQIMQAVHPCRATHRFLELLVLAQGDLASLESRDEVPDLEDAAAVRKFTKNIAEAASDLVPHDELTTELEALKSTLLFYDMHESFTLYLIAHRRLDITKNLTITLAAAYSILLSKVLQAVTREAR